MALKIRFPLSLWVHGALNGFALVLPLLLLNLMQRVDNLAAHDHTDNRDRFMASRDGTPVKTDTC